MRFSGTTLVAITLSAIAAACGSSSDDTASAADGTGGSAATAAGGSGTAGAGTATTGGAAGATTGKGGGTAAGSGGAGPGAGGSGAGGDPGVGGAGGDPTGAGGAGGDPTGAGGDPGTGGAGGDPGTGGSAPFVMADHPGYPALKNYGGPVLSKVQLVTVTFAGWAGEAHVQAYGDAIVQSDWLATVGGDYGVGKGTHLTKVSLNETAPATITDGQIQSFLSQRMNSGVLPKPTANTLYMIYFPKTTTITQGQGDKSCASFGGYHSAGQNGNSLFAYGVIPECAGGGTDLAISHELIEAATDNPYQPGNVIPQNQLWAQPAGGEVGDLCTDLSWKEGTFNYQRSWSKSAAAAGKEPCVPTQPGMPAFGVAPSQNGVLTASPGGQVKLTLTGWSDAPMANWHLGIAQFRGTYAIAAKFSSVLINNGYTSDMTITIPATAQKGSTAAFFIVSSLTGEGHYWPIVINVQ
jgi:hypothetical protein